MATLTTVTSRIDMIAPRTTTEATSISPRSRPASAGGVGMGVGDSVAVMASGEAERDRASLGGPDRASRVARLHATTRGPADAPVLVLASSLGTTGEMWAPLLEHLGDDLRVVCLDLRGHGGSEVPPGPYTMAGLGGDVLEWLGGEGLDRVWFGG